MQQDIEQEILNLEEEITKIENDINLLQKKLDSKKLVIKQVKLVSGLIEDPTGSIKSSKIDIVKLILILKFSYLNQDTIEERRFKIFRNV